MKSRPLNDSAVILVRDIHGNDLGWSTYGDYKAGKAPAPLKKPEPSFFKMLFMLPFAILTAIGETMSSM